MHGTGYSQIYDGRLGELLYKTVGSGYRNMCTLRVGTCNNVYNG